MELANPRLSDIHEKWIDTLSEEDERCIGCVIQTRDVLDAYFSVIDYFIDNGRGTLNIEEIDSINIDLLSSAVAAQKEQSSDKLKWETDYEKCSALFYALIKNHPFPDYYKRTALITALYYLAKLDRKPAVHQKELEIITLIIGSNTMKERKAFKPYSKFEDGEIRFLARYLQNHTHPINNKDYVMTYIELNKKLTDYGFYLKSAQGNSIDIFKKGKRSPLLGFSKNKKKGTHVGAVKFYGWTKEVAEDEMTLVRECTGLSVKEAFDARAVYKEAPPFSALINEYSGVLTHLAGK